MTAPSGEWGGHTGPLAGNDMLSSFGAPDVTVTPLPGGSLASANPATAEPVGADSVGTDAVRS